MNETEVQDRARARGIKYWAEEHGGLYESVSSHTLCVSMEQAELFAASEVQSALSAAEQQRVDETKLVARWQVQAENAEAKLAQLEQRNQELQAENDTLTRASSVPAKQLAELHLRNEKRLLLRIRELESEAEVLQQRVSALMEALRAARKQMVEHPAKLDDSDYDAIAAI